MSTSINLSYLYTAILLIAGFVFAIIAATPGGLLAFYKRTQEQSQTTEILFFIVAFVLAHVRRKGVIRWI